MRPVEEVARDDPRPPRIVAAGDRRTRCARPARGDRAPTSRTERPGIRVNASYTSAGKGTSTIVTDTPSPPHVAHEALERVRCVPARAQSRSWNRASCCDPSHANSRAARSALSAGTADHATLPSGSFVFSAFCARSRRAATRCPCVPCRRSEYSDSRKYSGVASVRTAARIQRRARRARRRRGCPARRSTIARSSATDAPARRRDALSDPRIDAEQHAARTPLRRIVQPVRRRACRPASHPASRRSRTQPRTPRTTGPPDPRSTCIRLEPSTSTSGRATHRREVLLDRAVVVVREVGDVRARGEHARDLALGARAARRAAPDRSTR